jgi:hypothetical protein
MLEKILEKHGIYKIDFYSENGKAKEPKIYVYKQIAKLYYTFN